MAYQEQEAPPEESREGRHSDEDGYPDVEHKE